MAENKIPSMKDIKLPSVMVDLDIYNRLNLEDMRIYPLPGGTWTRKEKDERFSRIYTGPPETSKVTYYIHLATVREINPGGQDNFYVAFQQTKDALYEEQKDPKKYPKSLMQSDLKKIELKAHIYRVYKDPKNITNLVTFEEWLEPIKSDKVFEAISYLLTKEGIFKQVS